MSIDPLAEDYVYNGTYNFSENRVIDAIELEGLEAVVLNAEARAGATVGGYVSIQLAVDVKGNVALQYSYGAGLFFGAGAGVGVGVSVSTAPTVYDLEGTGVEVGFFAGEVAAVSGEINFALTSDGENWLDGFTAPKDQYIGATVSVGPGLGLGAYLNLSNTETLAELSADDINQIVADLFNDNKEVGEAINGILGVSRNFINSNEGSSNFTNEQLQSFTKEITPYLDIINNQNKE